MREIKFKAWDKESKRMFDIARFDFADYTVYSHLFACKGYLAENLKIMQFTGLYDKNGKEIYEGDVVRFHYKTGVYKIGTVVWNDLFGSWDIDCSDFVSYKSLGQYKSVSEVIGNIYENPELIEGVNGNE